MRVCMLAYAFYESDTRIMQYATALADRGDSVDVLALRRGENLPHETIRGVNVYRIQSREVNEKGLAEYLFRILRFMVIASFILVKRHLSKPYKVIHVHSVPDFLVFAAIVPKLLGARVILDIHDIFPEFYASKFQINAQSLLFKLLVLEEKVSIALSDHVIIANHLWQDRLISRSVRAGKCATFINYPDPKMFYPRANPSRNGKFRIIYPGTLNTHQGLDIAIRAFAKVAGEMPTAEFQIYGEGPSKQSLIGLTEELGLSSRVIFHDFVPTQKIAEIMAASDLAVVPKRASSKFGNEAASSKIMEFMSLGVPVIVSRTRIDSYYHDESRVKFFESENESDLGNTILLLWRNPKLRKQMTENASEYVRQNNWHVKKLEYFHLVDGLASPKASFQHHCAAHRS